MSERYEERGPFTLLSFLWAKALMSFPPAPNSASRLTPLYTVVADL